MNKNLVLLAFMSISAIVLTGCGSGEESDRDTDESGPPVSVQNCGETVTFESTPDRVILLETAPVTIMDSLGLMDRVVARAGDFSPEYYDDELYIEIEGIQSLAEDLDTSGHFAISQETVVAQNPDLVLGQPEGISREGLESAGVKMLVQELYCPEATVAASYETLYAEIETYGEIFEEPAAAAELIENLQARVGAVAESGQDERRTAAVLYPAVGGGNSYAYGTSSMAHPQLVEAGFENIFSDVDERVFEVQLEELVSRDPDVLILLHQGSDEGVETAITDLPGAETITAVENGDIKTHLFNLTEPATPLSVEGLEQISDYFREE